MEQTGKATNFLAVTIATTISSGLAIFNFFAMFFCYFLIDDMKDFGEIMFGLSIIAAISYIVQWLIRKCESRLPLVIAILWVFIAGIYYGIWHPIQM